MKTIYFVLVVILLTVFVSCDKSEKTYSIKGRMIKDCSGTPVTSYSLRLYYKAGNSVTEKSGEVGTATTDADGTFQIDNVDFDKRLSLYLSGDNGTKWLDNFEVPVSDPGQTYDLGRFYGNSIKTAILKLSINLPGAGPNDSLYVGNPGAYQVVYPIPSSAVLLFSEAFNVPGWMPVDFHDTYPVYWGINKGGVDNAFNTGSHILRPKAGICQNPDTSFITIQ